MTFLKERLLAFLFDLGPRTESGRDEPEIASYKAAFLKYVNEGPDTLSESERLALANRCRPMST